MARKEPRFPTTEAGVRSVVLYNEVERHLARLRSLVAGLPEAGPAVGAEWFEGYDYLRARLPRRIDRLAGLLAGIQAEDDLSGEEKLARLYRCLPGQALIFVRAFADLGLETLADEPRPELEAGLAELQEIADHLLTLADRLPAGG